MFAKLLLIAACSAVAPPRISLDLAALHNAYKLDQSVYRKHDIHGDAVKSRQDWTEKCAAGLSTNTKTCPFPVAKAYDHQDKQVSVSTRVFLVDADGKTVNKQVKKVNFAKRSTYLFKYDASDAAGNHAEQVVFALILDDTKAPTINVCGKAAETVEAATKWRLCSTSTAFDNIDGALSQSIKYTITEIGKGVISRNKLISDAKKVIDTKTTGRFLVTLRVHDNAGAYGRGASDNKASARKAILVQDTTPPTISVHGEVPATQECAVKYTDTGATAADTLDGAVKVAVTSSVNAYKVGDYSVKYNAEDAAGNKAVRKTRGVFVRDTTKPEIWLKGKKALVHYSEDPFVEPGYGSSDTCDKTPKKVITHWNKKKFNDRKLGDYTRTYVVTDASGNKNKVSRKYTIVDNKIPIITITGKSVLTFEATRDADYKDEGATCQDYVDGVLNHAVESSGDNVNFRVPGTYSVHYDCQDLSGNAAKQLTRTVVVRDTTCPEVTLKGNTVNYIEAGFPYLDAGATATDTLDGDVSKKIFTDGDTVNTAQAFYSRRSCKEIKGAYAAAKTGEYYITTYAKGSYKRVLVWCDMKSGATYYQCTNCKRVNSAYGKAQGSCPTFGLRMAKFTKASKKAALAKFGKLYFAKASTDDYLCSTNTAGVNAEVTRSTKHDKITRAEAGKYVIFFHVTDKAGNAECKTLKRTVVVKDTLPPVITLHLNKKLIHQSKGGQAGLGGQVNPAGTNQNPFIRNWKSSGLVKNSFMAESQTSVNGWVLAAVASAVAGVALLGLSAKKSTTVSVPV